MANETNIAATWNRIAYPAQTYHQVHHVPISSSANNNWNSVIPKNRIQCAQPVSNLEGAIGGYFTNADRNSGVRAQ